jgi:hypothetical protein
LLACNGSRRARGALLWGLAAFVAGQLALAWALNGWWRVRDPEYGLRLNSLRARTAERAPGRPLLLFLGSSRVATGFRPDQVSENRPAAGRPVVFNFGMCRAGPVLELLTLRRLLADGVRPDGVFVEVWPFLSANSAASQMSGFQPERLRRQDRRAMRAYYADSRPRAQRWAEEFLPVLAYRKPLLRQLAPWLVDDPPHANEDWEDLDAWGWLRHESYDTSYMGQPVAQRIKDIYLTHVRNFAPSDGTRRAFADLLALCRRERIAVVLVAMPDGFLADYDPAGRARMDDFLRELSAGPDVPLIDARAWLPPDDLVEGVHLTHAGAAAFTERFEREVLRPHLNGAAVARCPPGVAYLPPTTPSPGTTPARRPAAP